MNITIISDTHEEHERLKLPGGDLLIHCGDWTWTGEFDKTMQFLQWFKAQPYKNKVLVAGNHDRIMDRSLFNIYLPLSIPDGVTYLENSSVVVDGYCIWGSPYSRRFHRWAFMHDNDAAAMNTWSKIPQCVDILITHGPPIGILDEVKEDGKELHVGCKILRGHIKSICECGAGPFLHCFGHVHERHGVYVSGSVAYVNASIFGRTHEPDNGPVILKLHNRCVEVLSTGLKL